MAIELKSLEEVFENNFSNYYLIYKEDLPHNLPIKFRAAYYGHGQKSILKCVGDENIEHVYAYCSKSFDAETVKKCFDYALSDGQMRIRPNKRLSSANIKVIFISNGYSNDALELIRKTNYHKSHVQALFSSTDLISCAVDASIEKAYANSKGSDMKDYFRSLMRAQHKE